MRNRLTAVITALSALVAVPAHAQRARSVDLTVNDVGLSIGDSRRVTGLRLNYRDRNLERVNGINATLWMPYEDMRGVVRGIALGVPATGARRIEGIAAGIIGIGADESIRGLGVGGIGLGVGEDFRGIGIGGIGLGVGQNASGILLGGIGAGVGGNMTGLSIAGIGVGAGGNVKGLSITGIGMGAGGDVTGVQIAGIGIGSGGTLKYVSIAGAGIGAPRIEGLAIAAGVGAENARGVIIAPIYFRIQAEGKMRGVNLSAYNNIRGTQQGLAIGIFNYARTLDGVQVGLLNYAGNKSHARLLPVFNYAKAR